MICLENGRLLPIFRRFPPILIRYNNVRIISIAQKVIRNFILHASIAKPLGESGKLQLTSDMTALEFALSAFVHDGGAQKRTSMKLDVVADDYRALRALR